MKSFAFPLAAFLLASCSTLKFPHHPNKPDNDRDTAETEKPRKKIDTSDEARRRFIVGNWYDHYISGMSFADGVSTYNRDGTFSVDYKSVAPGISADHPTQTQETIWSGKWKIEQGQLYEDITKTSAPEQTPADRPLIRGIARLDHDAMLLVSGNGNGNSYSRKKPKPMGVTFTPNSQ
jgi:hypothetical protein